MFPQSSKIIFREILVDDIPVIHQLNSFAEVDKYNTLGLPESMQETENLILPIIAEQNLNPRPRYVWFLENKQNEFVGLVGIVLGKPKYFSSEIWYKIHPSMWKKGYASEAVNSVLSFCFNELKLHRVCAGCATENIASIRVLEKNGFIREGSHRKILPIRGVWADNYEYGILEEDYFKKHHNDT
jgi:RimJ/RimL family protein N-acetyltransferase